MVLKECILVKAGCMHAGLRLQHTGGSMMNFHRCMQLSKEESPGMA